MNTFLVRCLIGCGILFLAGQARAAVVSVDSEQMRKIKSLAGTWAGAGNDKSVVEFKIAADGKSVMETRYRGNAWETVSVYSDDANGKLLLQQYGMTRGFTPLEFRSARDNAYYFNPPDGSTVTSREPQLDEFYLTFVNRDFIAERWTISENMRPKVTKSTRLVRRSPKDKEQGVRRPARTPRVKRASVAKPPPPVQPPPAVPVQQTEDERQRSNIKKAIEEQRAREKQTNVQPEVKAEPPPQSAPEKKPQPARENQKPKPKAKSKVFGGLKNLYKKVVGEEQQ